MGSTPGLVWLLVLVLVVQKCAFEMTSIDGEAVLMAIRRATCTEPNVLNLAERNYVPPSE